eukprot:1556049-Amphidinium_carterae.1
MLLAGVVSLAGTCSLMEAVFGRRSVAATSTKRFGRTITMVPMDLIRCDKEKEGLFANYNHQWGSLSKY